MISPQLEVLQQPLPTSLWADTQLTATLIKYQLHHNKIPANNDEMPPTLISYQPRVGIKTAKCACMGYHKDLELTLYQQPNTHPTFHQHFTRHSLSLSPVMKVLGTAVCLLLCSALCASQTCRPVNRIVLHLLGKEQQALLLLLQVTLCLSFILYH